ncbi:MAG: hypothetical protein LBT78_04210 [Tannerella sp.]|jgi:hypothetical protein|nr:hypothetical protein [Tannerella sp.]
MGMFSFYSVRKPRRFDHKPIYWDPRKEALEARIRRVKREAGELSENPEDYQPSIKGSFIEGTTHLKKSMAKGDDVRNRIYRNMRLLLILSLLVVLFWYFFLK